MEIEKLLKLYHSHRNKCCKCGCELISELDLGSVVILDYDGNFYCPSCDEEFKDADERIFEAEFYEDFGEEEFDDDF